MKAGGSRCSLSKTSGRALPSAPTSSSSTPPTPATLTLLLGPWFPAGSPHPNQPQDISTISLLGFSDHHESHPVPQRQGPKSRILTSVLQEGETSNSDPLRGLKFGSRKPAGMAGNEAVGAPGAGKLKPYSGYCGERERTKWSSLSGRP